MDKLYAQLARGTENFYSKPMLVNAFNASMAWEIMSLMAPGAPEKLVGEWYSACESMVDVWIEA